MKKIITFISSAGAEAVRILFETAPEKQTGRRRPVKRILERDAILHQIEQSELLFFERHPAALPLYEAFSKKLFERFPSTDKKVQKSQITFSNRYLYVCVSFLRVKKKAELPEPYFVVTLGLPYPLDSPRVAARTEPYPGRWTTHPVLSSESELDDELFRWIGQTYDFSAHK